MRLLLEDFLPSGFLTHSSFFSWYANGNTVQKGRRASQNPNIFETKPRSSSVLKEINFWHTRPEKALGLLVSHPKYPERMVNGRQVARMGQKMEPTVEDRGMNSVNQSFQGLG